MYIVIVSKLIQTMYGVYMQCSVIGWQSTHNLWYPRVHDHPPPPPINIKPGSGISTGMTPEVVKIPEFRKIPEKSHA